MKVRPDQLKQHLKKDLQSIYFVCGDEPLQVVESTDVIRAMAREKNYTEREVMDVDARFDWSQLLDAGNSMSLFSDQRILELRMPGAKPGKAGSQALLEYAKRPADDAILIISSGKLEGSAKNTKWFKTLDQSGVVVECWPISPEQLPRWIEQRMLSKGLTSSRDGIAMLAERVEGNLLAASQEIDKLFLLYGKADLSLEQLTSAVSDSARYSIYDLVDSALKGDLIRTTRIVSNLKNEGVEPVLVLWAMTREIRLMTGIASANVSMDAAIAKARVWDNRKALIKKALSRHSAQRWKFFLKRCSKIDKVIKGVEMGRAWHEILLLSSQIAKL